MPLVGFSVLANGMPVLNVVVFITVLMLPKTAFVWTCVALVACRDFFQCLRLLEIGGRFGRYGRVAISSTCSCRLCSCWATRTKTKTPPTTKEFLKEKLNSPPGFMKQLYNLIGLRGFLK